MKIKQKKTMTYKSPLKNILLNGKRLLLLAIGVWMTQSFNMGRCVPGRLIMYSGLIFTQWNKISTLKYRVQHANPKDKQNFSYIACVIMLMRFHFEKKRNVYAAVYLTGEINFWQ